MNKLKTVPPALVRTCALHSVGKSSYKTPVTFIKGVGIWPELMDAVQRLSLSARLPLEFDQVNVSSSDPAEKVIRNIENSLAKTKVAISGITRSPKALSAKGSLHVDLRKKLDLYGNIVCVRNHEGIQTRHSGVNFVVIREQVEGEYSALEHESTPGVVESLKIITRKNSERIAKLAFDYATRNNRQKVTAVHKANIMKLGDGLFLQACRDVAKMYPDIEFEAMIVDNCCMQLVSKPQQFDVMVMPNLYGSIVENLGAGLVGGAGVVPGASFSHKYAVFHPGARHTYSKAANKNIANPTAIFMAFSDMLKHLGFDDECQRVRDAICGAIKSNTLTADVGGSASTTKFTEKVISLM